MANRAKLKVPSQLVILLFVFLDLLLLLIVRAQVPPATGIYFWSSLVWFSWYWFAKSREVIHPSGRYRGQESGRSIRAAGETGGWLDQE